MRPLETILIMQYVYEMTMQLHLLSYKLDLSHKTKEQIQFFYINAYVCWPHLGKACNILIKRSRNMRVISTNTPMKRSYSDKSTRKYNSLGNPIQTGLRRTRGDIINVR